MVQNILEKQTQRLFVAIPVPEHISRKLEDWTLDHKAQLRFRKWTHPRDYHITLQFWGIRQQRSVKRCRMFLEKRERCRFH